MKKNNLLNVFVLTTVILMGCSNPANQTNNTGNTGTNTPGKKHYKVNPDVKIPDGTVAVQPGDRNVSAGKGDTVKGIILAYVLDQAELDQILNLSEGTLVGGDHVLGLAEIKIPDNKDVFETADSLLQKGFNVHPDYFMTLYATASPTQDPFWEKEDNTYWLKQMNVPQAWEAGEPAGVKIGVIEFGAENHEDLHFAAVGENARNDKGDIAHANHVMGIINATPNNNLGLTGIMKGKADLSFYPISGDSASTVIALRKAADAGVRVVNMSYGASYSDPITDEQMDKASKDDNETAVPGMDYARSKNMLVVMSAGNGITKKDSEGKSVFSRAINTKFDSYSAMSLQFDNILCVANNDKNHNKAESSNFGEAVNISAPGEDIYSTVADNKYENLSGTSMSSPAVVGVAGLVLSKYPNLTYLQLKEALISSATIKVNEFNFPIVDAAASLEYAKRF
jgi:hypothetical protein